MLWTESHDRGGIALPRDEFFEKIREEVEVFWHRSNGRRVVKWEGG